MIKNQKQAALTRDKVEELRKLRDTYVSSGDALRDELSIKALDGVIAELDEQISIYNSLVDGNFHCLKPQSLEEISNVLIAARLAQKMSQKDLAEILDLKEQQIQRYESSNYETASWPRIMEVALALRLEFSFNKIIIINTEDEDPFTYPKGLSKAEVDKASIKVKQQHSWIL